MEGYPKLAQLMANVHTDGHFLIFQKFEDLSAQNLLYLQAEIVNIRERVLAHANDDLSSGDPERRKFSSDWEALSSSDVSEQWKSWLQLRIKLKEYYEAISQHKMVSSLQKPHKSDLNFLQQWLERPNLGNCSFIGADCYIYGNENGEGLANLSSCRREVDPLTRFLLYNLPKIYHYGIVTPFHSLFGRWIKKPEISIRSTTLSSISNPENTKTLSVPGITPPLTSRGIDSDCSEVKEGEDSKTSVSSFDIESNVFMYRDSYLHHTANILGTLISSLIFITAIVVLYLVADMKKRLAILGVFTSVFALALSLITRARRVEIFAATAA